MNDSEALELRMEGRQVSHSWQVWLVVAVVGSVGARDGGDGGL